MARKKRTEVEPGPGEADCIATVTTTLGWVLARESSFRTGTGNGLLLANRLGLFLDLRQHIVHSLLELRVHERFAGPRVLVFGFHIV